VARAAFVVVAAGLCGYALVRQWPQVRAGVVALGWPAFGLSLVAVLAGLVATMLVWRTLLAALGSVLPLRAAARIFFLGQLGKYVPGSVWPIVAQMDLARGLPGAGPAGRRPRRVLTMLVSLCGGVAWRPSWRCSPLLASGSLVPGYRWALLAWPCRSCSPALHPRVVNPVVDRAAAAGPAPAARSGRWTGRAVAVALAWALLSWLLLGGHDVGDGGAARTPRRAGGVRAGGGRVRVRVEPRASWPSFAPAGAGVRDVLLVAVLSGTGTRRRPGDRDGGGVADPDDAG
jgi:hypothetical protein